MEFFKRDNKKSRVIDNIYEYTQAENLVELKKLLKKDIIILKSKFFKLLLISFLSIAIACLYRFIPESLMLFQESDFLNSAMIYVYLNTLFIMLTIIISRKYLFYGLRAIFKFKWNWDSAIALLVFLLFLQCIVSIIMINEFIEKEFSLYASLANLGMLLNVLGKIFMFSRIFSNLSFLSLDKDKYSLEIIDDKKSLNNIIGDFYSGNFNIVYKKKIYSNFAKNPCVEDNYRFFDKGVSPLVVVFCIIVGIFAGLHSNDFMGAIIAAIVSLAFCIPMNNIIAVNFSMYKECKLILKDGAMVEDSISVKKFSNATSILIDSNDLYPGELMTFQGIKTFQGKRLDEALMSAAAIVTAVNSPLKVVFSSIIKGNKNIIPVATNIIFEDEMGLVGWVNGRRILVGNRNLLKKYGILPPIHEVEDEHFKNNSKIIYLAVGGELFAMCIISYAPHGKMISALKRLEKHGVSILIRNVDSNINSDSILKDFNINSFKFLKFDQIEKLDIVIHDQEKSDGYVSTLGKGYSSVMAVLSCINIKHQILVAMIIQVIAIVFGVGLTCFLTFFSGLSHVGIIELIVYVLFWFFTILLTPKYIKI